MAFFSGAGFTWYVAWPIVVSVTAISYLRNIYYMKYAMDHGPSSMDYFNNLARPLAI